MRGRGTGAEGRFQVRRGEISSVSGEKRGDFVGFRRGEGSGEALPLLERPHHSHSPCTALLCVVSNTRAPPYWVRVSMNPIYSRGIDWTSARLGPLKMMPATLAENGQGQPVQYVMREKYDDMGAIRGSIWPAKL